MTYEDPETAEGWQLAVNLADACLALAAARSYGLILGGPGINVARCQELLQAGEAQGFTPAADAIEQFVGSLARASCVPASDRSLTPQQHDTASPPNDHHVSRPMFHAAGIGDVAKCPQCGQQTRSHSRGCPECGYGAAPAIGSSLRAEADGGGAR